MGEGGKMLTNFSMFLLVASRTLLQNYAGGKNKRQTNQLGYIDEIFHSSILQKLQYN